MMNATSNGDMSAVYMMAVMDNTSQYTIDLGGGTAQGCARFEKERYCCAASVHAAMSVLAQIGAAAWLRVTC